MQKLEHWQRIRPDQKDQSDFEGGQEVMAKSRKLKDDGLLHSKSKQTQKKKVPLARLRKKAWALHSKLIRMEEGKCFTCGKVARWQDLDCGHYIHKRSMDHVRPGLHAQCTTCNRWKHGNLGEYSRRLIEVYGSSILANLKLLSNTVKQLKREEAEKKIAEYELEIKKLEVEK